jgi:hypothetical protein
MLSRFLLKFTLAVVGVWMAAFPLQVLGQEDALRPVTRTYAITNATIVQAPGRTLEQGTVIIKDGVITQVGKNLTIPTGAHVIKADSMFVYAGFIDGLSHTGVNKPKEEERPRGIKPASPPDHLAGITPQEDVRAHLDATASSIEDIRKLGFGVAQVVPHGLMLPGSGSVILLTGTKSEQLVLKPSTSLYSQLQGARGLYPNTVIGVMAKWRELYKNAEITKRNETLYAQNPTGLERPAGDRVLQAFYPVIDKRVPVVFKAKSILDVQRVLTLQKELGFPLVLAEVREGRDITDKIKASGASVFLSLELPELAGKKEEKKDEDKKEDKKTPTAAEQEKAALEARNAEFLKVYTEQAAAFHKAGIPFGFSTMDAKSKDIQANLRKLIESGLPEDAALAALTVNPARILGLSAMLGTVENGKMANLVITNKKYFDEKAEVRYVFVGGDMYEYEAKPAKKASNGKANGEGAANPEGTWTYSVETPQGSSDGKLIIKKSGSKWDGSISSSMNPESFPIEDVEVEGNKLSFTYSPTMGGQSFKVEVTATIEGNALTGSMSLGQWGSFKMEGQREPK